jgi:PIN domain
MFKLLIDTCVWIDLAKKHQDRDLLDALETLIQDGQVSLILPRTIVDEFARNKRRTIEAGRQSVSDALKRVKDLVHSFGDGKKKVMVIEQLNDVDHRLPALGESVTQSVQRIEKLFKTAPVIETSEAVKLHAVQRAIDERAPFHRQKNSINDAILIETYATQVAEKTKGERFAFVTHNWNDFSATSVNNKLPHPDIAAYFSKTSSLYFTTLGETLRRVEPGLLRHIRIEQKWTEEPRRLKEILDAMDILTNQVWYNRHHNLRYDIERGKVKIVEKETFPVKDHSKRPIQRDIWEGALKSAATLEKKYGLENLGPWHDFEWGMINGKLSALRWVLGEDWDELYT